MIKKYIYRGGKNIGEEEILTIKKINPQNVPVETMGFLFEEEEKIEYL